MAYAKSSDIRVYPTAWRGKDADDKAFNPEASLNTEENLTNLSNRLASDSSALDCFVVRYESTNKRAVVVLHGYIFEINNIDTLGTPLYAKISLMNAPTTYAGREFNNLTLACMDNGNTSGDPAVSILDIKNESNEYEFHGLQFSNTELASDVVHSIYALHILDEEGNVPESSWLNIKTTQIQDTAGSDKTKNIANKFTTENLTASSVNAASVIASSVSATSVIAGSVSASNIAGFSVYGGIVPNANNSYNLGSSEKGFKNVYVTQSIYTSDAHASTVRASSVYASRVHAMTADLLDVHTGPLFTNYSGADWGMYGTSIHLSGINLSNMLGGGQLVFWPGWSQINLSTGVPVGVPYAIICGNSGMSGFTGGLNIKTLSLISGLSNINIEAANNLYLSGKNIVDMYAGSSIGMRAPQLNLSGTSLVISGSSSVRMQVTSSAGFEMYKFNNSPDDFRANVYGFYDINVNASGAVETAVSDTYGRAYCQVAQSGAAKWVTLYASASISGSTYGEIALRAGKSINMYCTSSFTFANQSYSYRPYASPTWKSTSVYAHLGFYPDLSMYSMSSMQHVNLYFPSTSGFLLTTSYSYLRRITTFNVYGRENIDDYVLYRYSTTGSYAVYNGALDCRIMQIGTVYDVEMRFHVPISGTGVGTPQTVQIQLEIDRFLKDALGRQLPSVSDEITCSAYTYAKSNATYPSSLVCTTETEWYPTDTIIIYIHSNNALSNWLNHDGIALRFVVNTIPKQD